MTGTPFLTPWRLPLVTPVSYACPVRLSKCAAREASIPSSVHEHVKGSFHNHGPHGPHGRKCFTPRFRRGLGSCYTGVRLRRVEALLRERTLIYHCA